ncbi:beta-1,3-galactosyltransferase 1-like isoform X2 [Planococcus citri]|uniref:beta-1,3-galactosyltransferase 1-like isoform X2 n=1 Tax=Planococcus citri TaxID=170843 RepID=UPI0031F93918
MVIKVQCLLSRIIRVIRRHMFGRILNTFLFLVVLSSIILIVYIYFREEPQVDGWEKGKIRRASLYVHPNNDTSFTHADANICSTEQPLVIIIICSDTKNINPRMAIRETWANDAKKYNITVLFLVGISKDEDINMKTLKESTQYKDIITEDFIDTYNNLTIKSVFMLKWVKNNCMQARFLMKADDDSYINIKNLFEYASLVRDEDLSTFLIGNTLGAGDSPNIPPNRFYDSKWYVPSYMYPYDEYPIYVSGAAYLMSTQVAEKLYNQSLQNEFIHVEDVYITGMCAQQINIKPKDNKLFHFFEKPLPDVKCGTNQSQLIVLSHQTDVYHMYKFHNELKEC